MIPQSIALTITPQGHPPKIDKVGRGARRLGRCESSLVGFMTRHALVDRFRLDHPGRDIWTWLDRSPSAKVSSYLDRELDELTLISNR